MLRQMCKGKIHSATITETKLFYEGSITIDSALLEAADIISGEKVEVLNLNNGSRIETYCLEGERDSGLEKLKVGHRASGIVGVIKIKEFGLLGYFLRDALQVWKKFVIRSYGKIKRRAPGKDSAGDIGWIARLRDKHHIARIYYT